MKPAILATLAATLIASLPTQSDKQTIARIKRVFASDKKTRDTFKSKRKTLRALRAKQTPGTLRALVIAYKALAAERDPIARERGRVLVERTSLEVARFRKKLDPIDKLQDEALAQIRAMAGTEASNEALAQLAAPTPLPLTLELALAAAAKGTSDASTLRKGLSRILRRGRIVAFLRVIRDLGPRGRMFARWVVRQLGDDSRTVRLETVRTIGAIGHTDAIRTLIDLLADEAGRVRDAILDSLFQLTKQRLGPQPDSWRQWLAKHTDADGKLKPGSAGRTVASAPEPKLPTYFGIPQKGDSILYVYDRSDSMQRSMKKGGSRIEHSRRELTKALRALPVATRFNIVSFSIRVEPWQDQLMQATKENVKDAVRWLRKLDLKAGTSSYDALERAFQIGNVGADDVFHEPEIETLFFLSDGEPTRRTGGFRQPLVRDDPQRILSVLRRWNALDRVVVHTIGLRLAIPSALSFMQDVARQNRGKFAAIR